MPSVTHRCGFTLIELLVVISIIALLIAILLPALESSRASARQIACLSNQRQLYMGAMLYADDHKGVLPNPDYRNLYWDDPILWWNAVPEYLQGDALEGAGAFTWLGDGNENEGMVNTANKSSITQIMRCPEQDLVPTGRTYAMNGSLQQIYLERTAAMTGAGSWGLKQEYLPVRAELYSGIRVKTVNDRYEWDGNKVPMFMDGWVQKPRIDDRINYEQWRMVQDSGALRLQNQEPAARPHNGGISTVYLGGDGQFVSENNAMLQTGAYISDGSSGGNRGWVW